MGGVVDLIKSPQTRAEERFHNRKTYAIMTRMNYLLDLELIAVLIVSTIH